MASGNIKKVIDDIHNWAWLRHMIVHTCQNRAWIITQSRRVGLGPATTRRGDIITTLLGCSSLVALAPDSDDQYQVLGCCYMHGLNWAESLIGPVPKGSKVIRTSRSTTQTGWEWRFQNIDIDEITPLDPRISWEELAADTEPTTWFHRVVEDSGKITYYRRPDTDYFRRHGASIRTFNLI